MSAIHPQSQAYSATLLGAEIEQLKFSHRQALPKYVLLRKKDASLKVIQFPNYVWEKIKIWIMALLGREPETAACTLKEYIALRAIQIIDVKSSDITLIDDIISGVGIARDSATWKLIHKSNGSPSRKHLKNDKLLFKIIAARCDYLFRDFLVKTEPEAAQNRGSGTHTSSDIAHNEIHEVPEEQTPSQTESSFDSQPFDEEALLTVFPFYDAEIDTPTTPTNLVAKRKIREGTLQEGLLPPEELQQNTEIVEDDTPEILEKEEFEALHRSCFSENDTVIFVESVRSLRMSGSYSSKKYDSITSLPPIMQNSQYLDDPQLLPNQDSSAVPGSNVWDFSEYVSEEDVIHEENLAPTNPEHEDEIPNSLNLGTGSLEEIVPILSSEMEVNAILFNQIASPLFDKRAAIKFLADMGVAFRPFNGKIGEKLVVQMIGMINETMGTSCHLGPNGAKTKQLASELIALALFPPLIENGQPLAVLSFDMTLACLKQLVQGNLLDRIDSRYFAIAQPSENSTLGERIKPTVQKLYLISRLNLLDKTETSGFVDLVFHSPDLFSFLKNARIHVPQAYRQTCVATAHCLYFQRRLGTIAEMVHATHAALQPIRLIMNEKLRAPNSNGSTPNIARSQVMLDTIYQQIAELKQKLSQKDDESTTTPLAIAQMTREWNFMMQNIATILDPEKPKNYSPLYKPDYFALSSVLSAISTKIAQYAFQGIPDSEIWIGLTKNEMKNLGNRFLRLTEPKYICRSDFQEETLGKTLEISQEEDVWNEIYLCNGSLLNKSEKTTGASHLIFVEAGFTAAGEKCFFINDPTRAQEVVLMNAFKKHFANFYTEIYAYKEKLEDSEFSSTSPFNA